MADNIKDDIMYPETITVAVQSISKGVRNVYVEEPVTDCVIKFEAFVDTYRFVQTEDLTEAGIAVHPYGAIIVPDIATAEKAELEIEYAGVIYSISNVDFNTLEVGDTFEVSENGEVMPDKEGGTKLYGPYYATNENAINITSDAIVPMYLGGQSSEHIIVQDRAGGNYLIDEHITADTDIVHFVLTEFYVNEKPVEIRRVLCPDYYDDGYGEFNLEGPKIEVYNGGDSTVSVGAGNAYIAFYTDKELVEEPG